MSKFKLISVVIPSYNHEKYIGEAIASVLRSSVQDFEIIIVDDGSVDNSIDVITRFDDPRITVIRQSNMGAHAAINLGVAHASAAWIAILNSDDRFHKLKLQRHLELHEKNPDLEASASAVRYISESGAPFSPHGYLNWRYGQLKELRHRDLPLKSSLLLANHLITTSALFVSKKGFNEVGGFIPLRYVHDWFFFLMLADRGRFRVLEEELVDYRIHGRNTIRENDNLGRVEDNFVLEWHVQDELLRISSEADVIQVMDLLKQNKRFCPSLMLLFQLWRTANKNDLHKCVALFEIPGHPLIKLALETVREDCGGLNLKTRARKLFGERLWSFFANHKIKQTKFLMNCPASLDSLRRKI
ncbi:MAG: glycosyltransferase family 2 protein [Desulfomonilaceae bacterium]